VKGSVQWESGTDRGGEKGHRDTSLGIEEELKLGQGSGREPWGKNFKTLKGVRPLNEGETRGASLTKIGNYLEGGDGQVLKAGV